MKVLLVDDEQMEMEMLENHVDWKGLGVKQVRKAINGKRAFQMILDDVPDIVITDIQMPVMDGFTLARKIAAENLPIKIIYLTGFDYFSYIQAAFKVEAVDYILKPVVPAQISSVVARTVELVKKENQIRQTLELSKKMMIEKILKGEQSEELSLRFKDDSDTYYLLYICGEWKKTFYKSLFHKFSKLQYGAFEKSDCYFLISSCYKPQLVLGDILHYAKESGAGEANGGYSKKKYFVWELSGMVEKSNTWQSYLYNENIWEAYSLDQIQTLSVGNEELKLKEELIVRELQERLPKCGMEEIYEVVQSIPKMNGRMRRKQCVDLLSEIIVRLDTYFVDGNPVISQFVLTSAQAAVKKIEKAAHIQTATTIFYQYVMQIYSYFQVQKQGKHMYVVLQVKEYVREHYMDAIDMDDLSEQLCLSINYIRSIFKEETGQTILEYITDYRFSRALFILKDRTLKVSEVSRMVGYDNVSYFNSIFVKRYGMSPGEYRNSL